jgi:hypothetical protein
MADMIDKAVERDAAHELKKYPQEELNLLAVT